MFALVLIVPSVGNAQVTTSITPTTGTGNLGTTVTQGGNLYDITGGTRPGNSLNLFHSFGDFSVGGGDIANFLNNTGLPTSNILGRVTGGNISNIYGTIQTTDFGNANLFLVNPSGMVFGPNGSVNVGGSVSFTTAQYLRLSDGVTNANFYANPANDGLTNSILVVDPVVNFGFLSSAAPAAYGFLTVPDPTATITVHGSNLSILPSLPDTPPNTISLVGGKVVIEGATLPDGTVQPAQLSAPSGRIHLATTTSPGEFVALPGESLANATTLQSVLPVDPASAASFTSYGLVSMAPGLSIDVGGTHTVFIKGGQLVLSVNDATLSTSENPVPPDTISLSPGTSIITSNSGTDPGADVQLTAGAVQMDGAMIQTINSGDLDGGNISINSTTVGFTNGTFIQTSTGLDLSTNTVVGSGNGGNVTVQGLGGAGSHADSFASNLSFILTNTFGPGKGGEVQLNARNLTMDNFSSISTGTSGGDGGQGGGGVGGDVVLNAGTGSLLGGASILSQTGQGGGQGGNVIIQGLKGVGSTTEAMTLSGGSSLSTQNFGVRDGGRVDIASKWLTLDGAGTKINSEVFDVGSAGDIVVSVKQASLSGGAIITSQSFSVQAGSPLTVQGLQGMGSRADSVILSGPGSGIISDSTGGTTRAGDVAVHAKSLTMADGAVIQAGTIITTAAGGNVTVDADSVDISGGSHISSQAADSDAGQITIKSNTFSVDNSSIAANTLGQGRAGDVVLNAGTLSLSNGANINTSTNSSGRAGDITIKAGSLTLTDRAEIASASTGSEATGNAGDISINSKEVPGNTFEMWHSTVSTSAALADGGNIGIYATNMVRLTDSIITSSVGNETKSDTLGGNVTIDPQFVVLQNSQIRANAFAGTGGAIDIIATSAFIADPSSIVNASSTLGVSGTVNIQSPLQNVGSELTALSQELSSVGALLAQQCAARAADGKFSTFVIAAREGLPAEPGGFLASPSLTAELLGSRLSGRDPQTQFLAVTGLFPQYDARPIQLAKFGDSCHW
jgi:filamentous hemagglutinin family protein